MGYSIETLAKKPVIWIKVYPPADSDDPIRLLMSLYEKARHLKDNQSLHIVLDISAFSFSQEFPISQFISVLGQVYDKWHSKYQLGLWVVADTSLLPVIRSFVRNLKIPTHVYVEYSNVIEAIEQLLGATDEFTQENDDWSFLIS